MYCSCPRVYNILENWNLSIILCTFTDSVNGKLSLFCLSVPLGWYFIPLLKAFQRFSILFVRKANVHSMGHVAVYRSSGVALSSPTSSPATFSATHSASLLDLTHQATCTSGPLLVLRPLLGKVSLRIDKKFCALPISNLPP